MRSRLLRALGGAAILAVVAPSIARAQRVRGTVRDSASREPLAGAVVTLEDSTGRFLAHGVADAQGDFAVPRVIDATRVRVLRIGFHPWEATLARGLGDTRIDVRMREVPLVLGAVTSAQARVCPGQTPASSALELWNEERAALLSMAVSRELHPPRVRLLSFDRRLEAVGKDVTYDSASIQTKVADRSYVAARPAWALASQGYVRDDGAAREYFVPDESVLLDTTFAETHCLSVVQGAGLHQEEIGIRFDALRDAGRDTIVDIDGVLWLDKLHPALRSLDYRYTALEPAAQGAGGAVHFSTMPTGSPMITHWMIHAPVLETEQAMSPNGITKQTVPRAKRVHARVIEYIETGGTLISADWDDGLHWHGAYPRLVGTVVDSATRAPARGARVWLETTGDTATTDSLGRFALPDVTRGIYGVAASDSTLARAGLARTVPSAVTLMSAGDHSVAIELHTRDEVLRLACPANSYRPGTATLLARVVDANGATVAGARIDVAALQQTVDADTTSRSVLRRGVAGSDGRFVICGADPHQPLGIQATKDGHTATGVVRDWGDGVVVLTLVMDWDQR